MFRMAASRVHLPAWSCVACTFSACQSYTSSGVAASCIHLSDMIVRRIHLPTCRASYTQNRPVNRTHPPAWPPAVYTLRPINRIHIIGVFIVCIFQSGCQSCAYILSVSGIHFSTCQSSTSSGVAAGRVHLPVWPRVVYIFRYARSSYTPSRLANRLHLAA